mmetsp:Transcript_87309/g.282130  ORF Transcript_87309/g.282130 Transcript_87309/m.282130 type:complete len:355 (+) Transcript_87309:1134-2198(+)
MSAEAPRFRLHDRPPSRPLSTMPKWPPQVSAQPLPACLLRWGPFHRPFVPQPPWPKKARELAPPRPRLVSRRATRFRLHDRPPSRPLSTMPKWPPQVSAQPLRARHPKRGPCHPPSVRPPLGKKRARWSPAPRPPRVPRPRRPPDRPPARPRLLSPKKGAAATARRSPRPAMGQNPKRLLRSPSVRPPLGKKRARWSPAPRPPRVPRPRPPPDRPPAHPRLLSPKRGAAAAARRSPRPAMGQNPKRLLRSPCVHHPPAAQPQERPHPTKAAAAAHRPGHRPMMMMMMMQGGPHRRPALPRVALAPVPVAAAGGAPTLQRPQWNPLTSSRMSGARTSRAALSSSQRCHRCLPRRR